MGEFWFWMAMASFLMSVVSSTWGLYQYSCRMSAEAALYGARVALKDPSISEDRVDAWQRVWDQEGSP